MPPFLSQFIIINFDSNSNAQLELSKLKSEFFENKNSNKESDALFFTNISTESSPQFFEQAYKK